MGILYFVELLKFKFIQRKKYFGDFTSHGICLLAEMQRLKDILVLSKVQNCRLWLTVCVIHSRKCINSFLSYFQFLCLQKIFLPQKSIKLHDSRLDMSCTHKNVINFNKNKKLYYYRKGHERLSLYNKERKTN
jgi:hypothetical protein